MHLNHAFIEELLIPKRILEPIIITNPDDIHWDAIEETVVVGFGCAGAVAALEAHEQGSKVLIIDRFEGGGASAYSGGVVYAGNTKYQRQAGFEDSAENMYNYLKQEVGDPIKGLYAAGRAAVGICGNGYNCSGLSLADGVFSGRRAGRNCAAMGGHQE